jgi:hypothetical protein
VGEGDSLDACRVMDASAAAHKHSRKNSAGIHCLSWVAKLSPSPTPTHEQLAREASLDAPRCHVNNIARRGATL